MAAFAEVAGLAASLSPRRRHRPEAGCGATREALRDASASLQDGGVIMEGSIRRSTRRGRSPATASSILDLEDRERRRTGIA
jgi:hypothetical protein